MQIQTGGGLAIKKLAITMVALLGLECGDAEVSGVLDGK